MVTGCRVSCYYSSRGNTLIYRIVSYPGGCSRAGARLVGGVRAAVKVYAEGTLFILR